jgi:hypothetical protein
MGTNERINEKLLDLARNRFFGKYRGIVKDNKDPTNRGRVKVYVPAVLGNLEMWALPCLPFTGENMGSYWIPEPEAGVWVEFEAGDPTFPIWVGGYWADNELPRDNQGNEVTPSIRIIRSQSGLMVSLDDQSQKITLSDENGDNFLELDVNAGKIKGNLKVVVEAPLIELVENATHPVVFGDNLVDYLNQLVQLYQTHTHPGELALGVFPVTPMPPAPPFPPAERAFLLSTKVKTG